MEVSLRFPPHVFKNVELERKPAGSGFKFGDISYNVWAQTFAVMATLVVTFRMEQFSKMKQQIVMVLFAEHKQRHYRTGTFCRPWAASIVSG